MKKIFITGGAGFIGYNAANYFLQKNFKVKVFDNLIRAGSRTNLKNLDKRILFERGDIRNFRAIFKSINQFNPDFILNCAGQVAVTKSVQNPRLDFESNALGTFNLLEAVRNTKKKIRIIHLSTNKVYGDLKDIKINEKKFRYEFINKKIQGITEKQNLEFHSPYGCSKGASEQYILDYHKTFGLDGIVLRQSCIYGHNQFGIEDQGWIAWMILCFLKGKSINIFGDGKQVRDILHIDDLLKLFYKIFTISKVKSRVYNVGGGKSNSISILELLNFLKKNYNKKINYTYNQKRVGDQKLYISDISRVKKEINWSPKISKSQGIKLILNWMLKNLDSYKRLL
jgi:CDP-paratose 2-epimerase